MSTSDTFTWEGGIPERLTVIGGIPIKLDLRQQVLSLNFDDDYDDVNPGDKMLFSLKPEMLALKPPDTLTTARAIADQRHFSLKLATLAQKPPDTFITAGIIANKAKQFDDGLMASVEEMLENGTTTLQGKLALLSAMVKSLASDTTAQALIGAALALGTGSSSPPDSVINKSLCTDVLNEFLKDEGKSKPLGFYNWTPGLSAVFKQDRLLQEKVDEGSIKSIAQCVASPTEIGALYREHVAVQQQLTNPSRYPDMANTSPVSFKEMRVFPPSMSTETKLAEEILGMQSIPPDFDLMKAFVSAVRAGKIDMKPAGDNTGWYAHCLYALETLILPDKAQESAKLALGSEYKKELIQLFKSLMALTRETHVKQLEAVYTSCFMPDAPKMPLAPRISVEPLATYYGRRADSYQVVRKILTSHFSERDLMSANRIMPGGATVNSMPLLSEIDSMIALFRGLEHLVYLELGHISRTRVPAAPTGPMAKVCPKGHALIQSGQSQLMMENVNYARGFFCDSCRAVLAFNGGYALHCTRCQFDVCQSCAQFSCTHGHPLIRRTPVELIAESPKYRCGFTCDGCKKSPRLAPNLVSLHCESCSYDICEECKDATTRGWVESAELFRDEVDVARDWLTRISTDIDVCTDNRMMVPVFYDTQRRMWKVWCVLGYATKLLNVRFALMPTVITPDVHFEVEPAKLTYIYPVFTEAYSTKLLNRGEFRRLCDVHKTQIRITSALATL